MNDQFDELAKGLAHSVTRRGALKKFGVGLAGLALASLGLANKAEAAKGGGCICSKADYGCGKRIKPTDPNAEQMIAGCIADCSGYCDCKKNPWGC